MGTMWTGLVEQKDKYIGGTLIEHGGILHDEIKTIITDMTLKEVCGDMCIAVEGKDWGMSANLKYVGLASRGRKEDGALKEGFMLCTTYGGGDKWEIIPKGVE